MVCNYNRALWKYRSHPASCEISGNSKSSDSSYSKQQQDFATVFIINRYYFELCGYAELQKHFFGTPEIVDHKILRKKNVSYNKFLIPTNW